MLSYYNGIPLHHKIIKTKNMRTKSIFITTLVVGSVLLLNSCGGQSNQKKTDAVSPKTEEVGKGIGVDDLLQNADKYVNGSVTVEAICTHICKHGGRKIFLMGSDDTQTIRVEGAKMGNFKQECVNSIVEVKGIMCEERIDEQYLKSWEERLKAQIVDKHGTGEEGCDTEKKARGETGNTEEDRIADFRAKIAARKADSGKDYLSFYYIEAQSYEIK